jgi:hypothetical protein
VFLLFLINIGTDPGGAAVAQRQSRENEKINEIERTRVCSPPRATFFKKGTDPEIFPNRKVSISRRRVKM